MHTALHIWQCKAKLAKAVSLLALYVTLAMYLLLGSTKAATMPGDAIQLELFLFTYTCKGQQAEDRPCSHRERHQQTDLSGCEEDDSCGAGLPAGAVLQRRFCASMVPPPQSSGQGLCAPSWPELGRSSAGLEDAVQHACKSRRTSSKRLCCTGMQASWSAAHALSGLELGRSSHNLESVCV